MRACFAENACAAALSCETDTVLPFSSEAPQFETLTRTHPRRAGGASGCMSPRPTPLHTIYPNRKLAYFLPVFKPPAPPRANHCSPRCKNIDGKRDPAAHPKSRSRNPAADGRSLTCGYVGSEHPMMGWRGCEVDSRHLRSVRASV